VPKRLVPLLALLVLSAAGCSGTLVATKPEPSLSGVSFRVSPGGGFDVTRVVRVHGVSWFAAMDNGAVLIYRWQEGAWRRAGRVRTFVYPFSWGGDSGLGRPALVTRSGAPDFTVLAGGADTQWFALIGRVHGRWRMIPFDYGRNPTAAIDARGVVGHLVHAQMNGCGCAAGPETFTWFRFNGRLFVPTAPPGAAPACSARALDRAGLVLGGFPDRLDRHRALPFDVARFTCRDGSALARGTNTAGDDLAVYEQHEGHWLRAAVASPKVIGHGVFDEFAIPRSLLLQLARRIHQRLFRRPLASYNYGKPPAPPSHPTPRTTPVTLTVSPGTTYQTSFDNGIYSPGPSTRWLVSALESRPRPGGPPAAFRVGIYRWQKSAWKLQGRVRLLPERGPSQAPLSDSDLSWMGLPMGGRGVVISSWSDPRWTAVIADTGGKWRVIPFRVGHSTTPTVDASISREFAADSFASPGAGISSLSADGQLSRTATETAYSFL
jgi:hypothetical protein